MNLRFELKTFGSDTMLNYHLSQKFKFIGRSKFNYLINTLTFFLFLFNSNSTPTIYFDFYFKKKKSFIGY